MTDAEISPRRAWRILPSPTLSRSASVVMDFLVRRANFVYDPVTMLYASVSPGGMAHTASGRWSAGAVAAVSVAVSAVVRRTGRNLFALRVAFTIAAMLLMTQWADAAHHAYSPLGVPVAIAISMYYGPRGFVVPAAALLTMPFTGAEQRTTIAEAISVLVLGCVLGWGVSLYMPLRDRAIARQAALVEHARVAAAQQAGRASVLTANEGTADQLQRAGVLLSLHGSTVGRAVSEMKRRAAEEVTGTGAFLATVVGGWSAVHNRSPDLRRTVDVTLIADAAGVLLTRAQADHLVAELDRLALAGRVTIELDRGNPNRVDRVRQLVVAGHLVTVPAERTTRAWALSPLPVAAAMVALWMSQPAVGGLMEAPLVAVTFTVIGLVHAVRVHHLVSLDDRNITRAVNEIMVLFVVFAITCIPLSAPAAGNPDVTWPPAEGAAEFVVLVLMLARPHLPPWQRRAIPGYLLVAIGLNTLSFVSRFNWANCVAEGMFVPAMFLVVSGIGEAIARVSQQASADHEAHATRGADAAYIAGQRSANGELSDQLARLKGEFARHRHAMAPDLADEIQRRIHDAERAS